MPASECRRRRRCCFAAPPIVVHTPVPVLMPQPLTSELLLCCNSSFRYPSQAFVSQVLKFIGTNTPHYAQHADYAEGFQLFS